MHGILITMQTVLKLLLLLYLRLTYHISKYCYLYVAFVLFQYKFHYKKKNPQYQLSSHITPVQVN